MAGNNEKPKPKEGLVTWSSIKDYLLARTDPASGAKEKVPVGGMATAWMLLQRPPSEPYNEVYPGILLGDYQIASDPEKLKAAGVTHIINCAMGPKYNQINTNQEFFSESGIKFHGINAIDIMTFKMTPHFQKAVEFLDDAQNNGGTVYVHCMSGVSRSATIIIAYLMSKRNMQVMDAVKKLRENRRILPNDGFLRELVTLNEQLHGQESSKT